MPARLINYYYDYSVYDDDYDDYSVYDDDYSVYVYDYDYDDDYDYDYDYSVYDYDDNCASAECPASYNELDYHYYDPTSVDYYNIIDDSATEEWYNDNGSSDYGSSDYDDDDGTPGIFDAGRHSNR